MSPGALSVQSDKMLEGWVGLENHKIMRRSNTASRYIFMEIWAAWGQFDSKNRLAAVVSAEHFDCSPNFSLN